MPASKRNPGRRVGFSRLSANYRRRIERTVGRSAWEAGVDLRAARGKKPAPPVGAAPPEITQRVIEGRGTEADIRELGVWQATGRPRWIPAAMRDDVAAALSQLPNPSKWSEVTFLAAPDGAPWTMIVTPKRGYAISIEIPGGGAVGTGARDVLDLLTDPRTAGADMRYWNSWIASRIENEFFEVMGTT